jgi:hypothetical protein
MPVMCRRLQIVLVKLLRKPIPSVTTKIALSLQFVFNRNQMGTALSAGVFKHNTKEPNPNGSLAGQGVKQLAWKSIR